MNWTTRIATKEDIDIIITILRAAWYPAYGNILEESQSRYMLDTLFSRERLLEQMSQECHRFMLGLALGKEVGFAAFQTECGAEGICKLHKLYLRPECQGKGYGKRLLLAVVKKAVQAGSTHLILNVNRANRARMFYAHLGFENTGRVDIPIGAGYFMNDYIFSLPLPASTNGKD